MTTVFIATFFNSSIMGLLTNADWSYTPIMRFLEDIGTRGIYVDFNKNWYINASPQIVITMITTAFLPWIELIIFYLLSKCF